MRTAGPLAVAAIVALSVGLGSPLAVASCVAPPPVAELAQRADAVVYARVTGSEGQPGAPARFVFVRVERVLKGSTYDQIGVAVGPNVDGPEAAGATSVDYQMERGTDHTLYMKQTAPAGYRTDACSGSHPGAPTAEEESLFGAGKGPDRSPSGIDSTTANDRVVAEIALAIAIAVGVAAIVFATRSRRRGAPA